jgi:predicted amidohydrolase
MKMKKGFRTFSVSVAVILAAYFTWAGAGRKQPLVDIRLEIDSTYSLFADSGKGNIVGISPYMLPVDYASRQHFLNKLDGYMQAAHLKGWLTPKTVVVFPEYIGSWLVVEGQKSSIYQAEKVEEAMRTYMMSNLFSYLRDWFTTPDETGDKLSHSIFSSQGYRMAASYREVFGVLARKYGVTIIAGSILLPNPEVVDDRLKIKMGPLYNVSAIFDPNGSIRPHLIRKCFPVEDEKTFVVPESPEKLPVFDLPCGSTAVQICADSWFPETYTALQNRSPRIIAVPAYTPGNGSMDSLWKGYSGQKMPADVDSTDRGRITLADAWQKYALPGRIRSSSASYGIVVPLRGKLWDLGTDGSIIAMAGDSIFTARKSTGAAILNMYLH